MAALEVVDNDADIVHPRHVPEHIRDAIVCENDGGRTRPPHVSHSEHFFLRLGHHRLGFRRASAACILICA